MLGPAGFNWLSYLAQRNLHRREAYSICESSFLNHYGIYHDLFVLITDRSKAILRWWFFLFYVLVFKRFVLFAPYVCCHVFS